LSGSFCRIVCSMTRRPAKPIEARASAMMISAWNANEAETPPVVGSVSTVTYRLPSHEALDGLRRLRHLHQREHAFFHARTAAGGENDARQVCAAALLRAGG
jgi:hypothetical protein